MNPREDPEERALAALWYTEVALWVISGALAALHVYRVVRARTVFSSEDTLAALFVAVLLSSATRLWRQRQR